MKTWTNDIEKHIEHWSKRLGNLYWWPRYVYHFTDVQNAARILDQGRIYSRTEATRLGLMQNDNASPEVIQQTAPAHLDFVRFYFRPRTPTQYQNEGIRPTTQRKLGGAHCPIPIFFGFDAKAILVQESTCFSDGNMGSSRVTFGNDQNLFSSIPFELVFHNRAFSEQDRHEIIFRRNAEVLVPEQLPIEPTLKFIACRSMAERQTLLHMLPIGLANQWASRIRVATVEFYERRWTYVEDVNVVDSRVIFRFNPNTRTPGPFNVEFTYQEDGSDDVRTWQGAKLRLDRELLFNFRDSAVRWGIASLRLDDALAFQGLILFEEIPF